MITLSPSSLQKLKGVHPDLVKVVEQCARLSDVQFTITCGLRSYEDQEKAVMGGFSKTMRSRHLASPHEHMAHAVDLAPVVAGKIPWNIANPKQKAWWTLLVAWMKKAAEAEGVKIEWGGDWAKFKDYPHFQLPWKDYPG